MIEIGKYNTLRILKDLDFGVYLDGGDGLEILLPARYVPKNVKPGMEVEVFIYHDNEGRLIATTAKPLAVVGEFKCLKVNSVNETGAFLEWGIMKDLLVPYREQKKTMQEGRFYIVYVHVDHVTNRIVASARINKYLDNIPPKYEINKEVNLLIFEETEIGFKAIINNLHTGMIYRNQVFSPLRIGQETKGFIKEIREDEKIDLSLTPLGYQKVQNVTDQIMETLKLQGGFIPLHDKSDPEEIHAMLQCSKKSFKQAIGALYREKKIILEQEGIRLV